MKVGTLTASLLAGTFACMAGLAVPALADSGKVNIPMTAKSKASDKAPAQSAKPKAPARTSIKASTKPQAVTKAAKRQAARKTAHRRANYYDYAVAQPIYPDGWYTQWRASFERRHGYHPPPPAYYPPPPPPADEQAGLEIDRDGWTGGVGYGASGDFVDGYGMLHYGRSGPTYNSYRQSFQRNPSVARPFQPRLMGHPAPFR